MSPIYRGAALALLGAAVLLALLVGLGRERQRVLSAGDGPEQTELGVERCLRCHHGPMDDPGGAHASSILGCSPCHLGNPAAYEADRAHEGLELEPGALETVGRTCGRSMCHEEQTERVRRSLMATNAGLVSVDLWAFGEGTEPLGTLSMSEVAEQPATTPGRTHLRRLCAGCHLGTRRDNRDDAVSTAVHGDGMASGCAACHSERRREGSPHPPVDQRVPDQRCLGCHSRSGRISLSYVGLAEVEEDQWGECRTPVRLFDGRAACRVLPDVHAEAGMSCVDCHVHTELMGAAGPEPPERKHDQLEVRCTSCHLREGDGPQIWSQMDDAPTERMLRARGETRRADEGVLTSSRGTPLWNIRPSAEGPWVLIGKNDGRARALRPTPADRAHRMPGHERLSCSSCHTSWAPRCGSCHTHFEPSQWQWDFGFERALPGAWREHSDGFGWGPPTLAIVDEHTIVPAVPGMVATLEVPSDTGPVPRELRLYATLEPHTTRREARTCTSCHRSAEALGLGLGELTIASTRVLFTPAEPPSDPTAPAPGGWVSLFSSEPGQGTHPAVRSLDAAEQRRTLRVGWCLGCHQGSDRIFDGPSFERSVKRGNAGSCPAPQTSW